jgi:hypothetical protein
MLGEFGDGGKVRDRGDCVECCSVMLSNRFSRLGACKIVFTSSILSLG